MKKLARVPEEFFGKLDLNNQIRGLLRLIPLKKFHICTIKKTEHTAGFQAVYSGFLLLGLAFTKDF